MLNQSHFPSTVSNSSRAMLVTVNNCPLPFSTALLTCEDFCNLSLPNTQNDNVLPECDMNVWSPNDFPSQWISDQRTRYTLVSRTSKWASLASHAHTLECDSLASVVNAVSSEWEGVIDFYVFGVSPGPVCCDGVGELNSISQKKLGGRKPARCLHSHLSNHTIVKSHHWLGTPIA